MDNITLTLQEKVKKLDSLLTQKSHIENMLTECQHIDRLSFGATSNTMMHLIQLNSENDSLFKIVQEELINYYSLQLKQCQDDIVTLGRAVAKEIP